MEFISFTIVFLSSCAFLLALLTLSQIHHNRKCRYCMHKYNKHVLEPTVLSRSGLTIIPCPAKYSLTSTWFGVLSPKKPSAATFSIYNFSHCKDNKWKMLPKVLISEHISNIIVFFYEDIWATQLTWDIVPINREDCAKLYIPLNC